MKYRSYNSELLIATTLMCDVFNDVIIDRRKHGLKRDFSKAITLADIVQQKIEVPCIIGDRSPILKSLENEPGRYKLPLIIIQMKDMKTDTSRMCDLHADVFYQQDSAFSELDETDSLYRPQELSKRRGQPITIDYDVTFVTKYREDLDQIISNFAVHFRPDVYLKWWHPRNKKSPLTSQLLWSHSVNFDSSVDYNPQNIFVYKGTTSFTFKSWLFFGMHATDNAIDKNLESVIKYFKLFPNRTGKDIGDDGENRADDYDESSAWTFGNAEKSAEGTLGFWTVDNDQEMTGKDPEKMKNGDYAVNNVFSHNYSEISGDQILSGVKVNSEVGDFFSNYEKNDINNFNKYQNYLMIDSSNIKTQGNAFVKNTYFKGSFPLSSFYEEPASGDYLFRKFFTIQENSYGHIKKAEFGESFIDKESTTVEYDIKTKDLSFIARHNSNEYSYYMKSKFNSVSGHFQEFELKSKPFRSFKDYIAHSFHKEYDINLNSIKEKNVFNNHNMNPINDEFAAWGTKLHIDDFNVKKDLLNIKSFLKAHWKSLNLVQKNPAEYSIEIEDSKAGKILKEKNIYDIPFRSLKMIHQIYENKYYYQILTNKYIYMVLKVRVSNEDDCEIYDFGILFPLKYASYKALLYEVTIPESRELLGLNFYLGL